MRLERVVVVAVAACVVIALKLKPESMPLTFAPGERHLRHVLGGGDRADRVVGDARRCGRRSSAPVGAVREPAAVLAAPATP